MLNVLIRIFDRQIVPVELTHSVTNRDDKNPSMFSQIQSGIQTLMDNLHLPVDQFEDIELFIIQSASL